jgi:CRP/FNR family cyclic AMP-dependent transcriptional regulator
MGIDLEIREIDFPAGATVVVQNSENPGYFYIVRSGTLEIDSEHRLADKVLSRFGPGDSFGLVSGLTGRRFLVTIFAATPARVARIPVRMLGTFLEQQKPLAMKLVALYSRELRALHSHLTKANAAGERDLHPRRLLDNARTYVSWGNKRMASYAANRFIQWAETENDQEAAAQGQRYLAELGVNYTGPVWTSNSQKLAAGEILFLENEISEEIYVVESGTVRLSQIVRGQEFIIDVLEAGELFGEMSLIDRAPRMASAVVEVEAVLIRLHPETLLDGIGAKVMQKIFESLTRRIWFSHQRLVVLRIPDPVNRIYAFLHNLIRDEMIRRGRDAEQVMRESFTFEMNLAHLLKMSGILKLSEESLKKLKDDSNLTFAAKTITVHDRKRLEEKVPYRTKTGQISANIV